MPMPWHFSRSNDLVDFDLIKLQEYKMHVSYEAYVYITHVVQTSPSHLIFLGIVIDASRGMAQEPICGGCNRGGSEATLTEDERASVHFTKIK